MKKTTKTLPDLMPRHLRLASLLHGGNNRWQMHDFFELNFKALAPNTQFLVTVIQDSYLAQLNKIYEEFIKPPE